MKVTALIAPYLDAIKAARLAGADWTTLSQAFGVKRGTLQTSVARCKYVAEQLPLPKTLPLPKLSQVLPKAVVVSSAATVPAPALSQAPAPVDDDFFDSISIS